jgi:hypothetical protein
VIERESTSVPKSAKKPKRETSVSWSKELDSAIQRGREYIWMIYSSFISDAHLITGMFYALLGLS